MRSPGGRAGGAILLAAFVLAGCAAASGAPGAIGGPAARAAADPEKAHFVIAGLVADSKGMPIPHLPVRVSSATRPLHSDPRLGGKDRKLLAAGETATDGTYRLIVPLAPGKRRYYLVFYAPGRFDEVRFARPARIDITTKVEPGASILLDHQLAFHGAWAKVQETLKAYPKNSPRALIIRGYGIAEEIHKGEGKNPEIWWYYSKGKRFDFRGKEMVGERSFMPVFK